MVIMGKMAPLERFCGHDLMDTPFGLMDAVFGLTEFWGIEINN